MNDPGLMNMASQMMSGQMVRICHESQLDCVLVAVGTAAAAAAAVFLSQLDCVFRPLEVHLFSVPSSLVLPQNVNDPSAMEDLMNTPDVQNLMNQFGGAMGGGASADGSGTTAQTESSGPTFTEQEDDGEDEPAAAGSKGAGSGSDENDFVV